MNAATRVFHIPELLEHILLSLPCDTTHQETSSIRQIIRAQTTTRTWHELLHSSTPIRQRMYRPNPADEHDACHWGRKLAFPPARPNPWIPDLLLHRRSWGSAYPFEHADAFLSTSLEPSAPRFWTFAFEMSRVQYARLPQPGPWRDMLAASPPFADAWSTRCVYELGSGRAPFVTHLDYDARRPKHAQRYRVHRADGITLGDMCDALRDHFDRHPAAKFVMFESLRVPIVDDAGEGPAPLSDDRPLTRTFVPGSSAEGYHDWHRAL